MSPPTEHLLPATVARLCLDAHREQDWEKLKKRFHPRARIGTFAGGGPPEDPEAAITRLQAAHGDLVYHADVDSLVELDDNAVLLTGNVRYRSPQGGWGLVERSWVYVVREGLLYRSAMYESQHEARGEYERLGMTLGVGD